MGKLAAQVQVRRRGFTIVELLIVVVVIAILAAITIVAYNGIQSNAKRSKLQADIRNVQRVIEAYNVKNGFYPRTATAAMGSGNVGRTDDNCNFGSSQADWIPDVTTPLPQSDGNSAGGAGNGGCFIYSSNGDSYILSAWNMLSSPDSNTMYRRVGFRELNTNNSPALYYLCNHSNIGGNNPTPYSVSRDYYKLSYTISNITGCNETPPPGAE